MVENTGDVLVRRTRLNHAAFSFDVDGFAMVRHALRALLKHARLLMRVDLFRFNIPDLSPRIRAVSTQAARISAAALTQIGRPVSLKWLSRRLDFDTQTSLQLFDVVIKRPTGSAGERCLRAQG